MSEIGRTVAERPEPVKRSACQLWTVSPRDLLDVLRESLEPFARRIDWGFVYGSIARCEQLASSDVDLMIVGRVGLAELGPALRQAERRPNRPVNPTIYCHREFAKKVRTGHHFLQAVLGGEKLFILGAADELAGDDHERT